MKSLFIVTHGIERREYSLYIQFLYSKQNAQHKKKPHFMVSSSHKMRPVKKRFNFPVNQFQKIHVSPHQVN